MDLYFPFMEGENTDFDFIEKNKEKSGGRVCRNYSIIRMYGIFYLLVS